MINFFSADIFPITFQAVSLYSNHLSVQKNIYLSIYVSLYSIHLSVHAKGTASASPDR